MGDLSTYSLGDFFPFTPEVYFRLFVRHNEAVWPSHIVAMLFGIAVVWLAWRGRERPVALMLAACWAWVGYTFHIDLYANLNWAATYFGWAFIIQGLLLAASGLLRYLEFEPHHELDGPTWVGLALVTFGLVFFPLIGPILGREWAGIQLFGIASDPTVIVTLGLVLMARKVRWILLIIPVVWAAISGATALQMESVGGLVTAAAALLALGAAVWKTARSHR